MYMNDKSMLAAIKSEMAVFECSGVRGRILQLVYSYLQSIPPTSVGKAELFLLQGHFVQRFVRASVTLRWSGYFVLSASGADPWGLRRWGDMASAEREPITRVWGPSPQRGPGAEPP